MGLGGWGAQLPPVLSAILDAANLNLKGAFWEKKLETNMPVKSGDCSLSTNFALTATLKGRVGACAR